MLQPRTKYQLDHEARRHGSAGVLAWEFGCDAVKVAGGAMGENGLFGKMLSVLFAVVLALTALATLALSPDKAQAAAAIDVNTPVSLELSLTPEGNPAEGFTFSVYRVADVSFNGGFTLTEPFSSYDISFEDDSAEGWSALAQSLNELVFADGITADAQAVTNVRGMAVFSVMPVGLYLVTGEAFQTDEASVVPAPFMVCLPDLSDDDEWIYDVQASVKSQIVPNGPSDGSSSGGSSQGKLPQTGQLWWPVPVLLLAGAALTAFGVVRLRRS